MSTDNRQWKYLVSQDLTGLLVDGELGAFLIRLLYDRILDLSIDTFILIRGLHLDDGAAIWRTFLHLRVIHPAVLENWFIIVHVGYEHHDNRGAGVNGAVAVRAARAVVQGGDVQLVFVAIQRDLLAVETDHTGDLLDHELPGRGVAADEAEPHVVAVLVGGDHGGDQGVRSGVLVDVRRINLLRELRLFVVFIFRVYPHRRRASFRRFAWKNKLVLILPFFLHLIILLARLRLYRVFDSTRTKMYCNLYKLSRESLTY